MTEPSRTYTIPDNLLVGSDERLSAAWIAAEDAVARIDERVRLATARDGLCERLHIYNARAAMRAQHFIVHLDELVLFDANAYAGTAFGELSQAADLVQRWRRAAAGDAHELLKATIPGDADAAIRHVEPDERLVAVFDPDWNIAGRLDEWRKVMYRTRSLPPILAAAVVWDAWAVLDPDERGPWRASLLAALVLRVRGKCKSLLLPLDLGRRVASVRWMVNDPIEARLAALCTIMMIAANETAKELDQLILAEGLLRRLLVGRRKNSKLSKLVDLLLAKPLVSLRMIAVALRVSKQAAGQMIGLLGSTPREMTERTRYRCWSVISQRRP